MIFVLFLFIWLLFGSLLEKWHSTTQCTEQYPFVLLIKMEDYAALVFTLRIAREELSLFTSPTEVWVPEGYFCPTRLRDQWGGKAERFKRKHALLHIASPCLGTEWWARGSMYCRDPKKSLNTYKMLFSPRRISVHCFIPVSDLATTKYYCRFEKVSMLS